MPTPTLSPDVRRARLLEIFQGDSDAVSLIEDVIAVTEVWDDLVDGDREVTADDVTEAFTRALVDIPSNPHYLRHGAALRAVLLGAILGWLDSDAMRGDKVLGAEDVITAHVVRYQIVDVALVLLVRLFGLPYAREHSTEIRRMYRAETIREFVES
jgi:hypothetical protein